MCRKSWCTNVFGIKCFCALSLFRNTQRLQIFKATITSSPASQSQYPLPFGAGFCDDSILDCPEWSRSALAQNAGNWTHLAKHLIEGPQSAQNSVKHCGKFGAAEKNKADTMQSQGIMRVSESLSHTARRQLWRRKWEFVLNSSRPFFLPLLCLFTCLRDRVSLCGPGWTST